MDRGEFEGDFLTSCCEGDRMWDGTLLVAQNCQYRRFYAELYHSEPESGRAG